MPFSCTICEKEFGAKNKLQSHFMANHKCKWCPQELRNKLELKAHQKECENLKLFHHRCENCGKTFSHKGNYEKHKNSCSLEKQTSFKCQVCPKTFTTLQRKNLHEELHKENPKFNCEDCGKVFTSDKDLKDHRANHIFDYCK